MGPKILQIHINFTFYKKNKKMMNKLIICSLTNIEIFVLFCITENSILQVYNTKICVIMMRNIASFKSYKKNPI